MREGIPMYLDYIAKNEGLMRIQEIK